jgi:hypothetical protein
MYLDLCQLVNAIALIKVKMVQMQTFEPGEWIVRQAERTRRSTACYLLLSGEAAVLLHAPASPYADSEGLLHLCNRRAGNFVGAVQLHLEDSNSVDTPCTPSTARCGAQHVIQSRFHRSVVLYKAFFALWE